MEDIWYFRSNCCEAKHTDALGFGSAGKIWPRVRLFGIRIESGWIISKKFADNPAYTGFGRSFSVRFFEALFSRALTVRTWIACQGCSAVAARTPARATNGTGVIGLILSFSLTEL
jgi:hypothetical protein